MAITTFVVRQITRIKEFQFFDEIIFRVNTEKKVVALTFDDGPNPEYSNQILDILDRNNVKATFFLIGKKIEKYFDTAQLIFSKGHELGNHSYSHTAFIFDKSEIDKTDLLLRKIGVTQEIHFRSPYGKRSIVLPNVSRMKKNNLLFDVEPDPPDFCRPNPKSLNDYILKHTRPGSIILLHDGGGIRSETVIATEMAIKGLKEMGYVFKTVSGLLSYSTKG